MIDSILTQYEMRPSELDDFAIKRMIIYLRAGFLDKAKQLLSLIVSENEDPIRWNVLLGEAYLGSKVQGKDYPLFADTAFEKALGLLPIQDREGREYFKEKVAASNRLFYS